MKDIGLTYKGSDSHCIDKAAVAEKLEKSIPLLEIRNCFAAAAKVMNTESIWVAARLVLIFLLVSPSMGFCFTPGWNPDLSGPPIVHQVTVLPTLLGKNYPPPLPKVSSTSVNVSWEGLLLFSECADNIRVKHFYSHNEHQYEVTNFVTKSIKVFSSIDKEKFSDLR